MFIRPIRKDDNAAIERIIRECLIEFGGNREGLAWADPSMSDLYRFYADKHGYAYWIAEQDGEVLGGCGIAPFADSETVCELQKMYLSTRLRGTGVAAKLLSTAETFARQHYRQCYLETLQTMAAANRFYLKHGFVPMQAPLEGSEHFACDAWYIKNLNHPAG